MSLVQVQRSPSISSFGDDSDCEELDDSRCSSRNRSFSECYFAVRGAAVVLPQSDATASSASGSGGEIESHLQMMLRMLRPQDTLTMAVRLQTQVVDHVRYLALVACHDEGGGREGDKERNVLLLGCDYFNKNMSIGVVLPLAGCCRVELIGDGAVSISGRASDADSALLFKPVSVQAMWYVFQTLHRELASSPLSRSGRRSSRQPPPAAAHYLHRVDADDFLCAQWHQSPLDEDTESELKADNVRQYAAAEGVQAMEGRLRTELRQIMQSVDLDSVTSRDIRQRLATAVGESIDGHKDFIDREMLVILGQLEKPSRIFDYLYLGTEWNASNWDELHANDVGYILNMTREVDNFFPQHFRYMKIGVTDEADTHLLSHWNSTFDFIKQAKKSGQSVLVHCKKGISRSSSTVIAYAMKEYGWGLDEALDYVKRRRNCITPNKGFMEQLRAFGGALEASRHRHLAVFNSVPRPRRPLSASPAPRLEGDAVRLIVRSFETRRPPSEPAPPPHFPMDVINKRNSIQQLS